MSDRITEWAPGWRRDFRRTLEKDSSNLRFSVHVRALSRRLIEAIDMIDRLERESLSERPTPTRRR